jgi:hypothetical protein
MPATLLFTLPLLLTPLLATPAIYDPTPVFNSTACCDCFLALRNINLRLPPGPIRSTISDKPNSSRATLVHVTQVVSATGAARTKQMLHMEHRVLERGLREIGGGVRRTAYRRRCNEWNFECVKWKDGYWARREVLKGG